MAAAEWREIYAIGLTRADLTGDLIKMKDLSKPITLAGLFIVFLVVTFTLYAFYKVTQRRLIVSPISVPQALEAKGYSADVIAEHLESAINKVRDDIYLRFKVSKELDLAEVASPRDLPAIIIPDTEIRTSDLAILFAKLLNIDHNQNLSGEFTIAQDKLWLHLRLNDRSIYNSPAGDLEHPDDLIDGAAQEVLEKTDPFMLAVYLRRSDPSKSLELTNQFLFSMPKSSLQASWAHTLIGVILVDQGEPEKAVAEYRKAIEVAPHNAFPVYNVGNFFFLRGRIDEAIAAWRTAISLDPSFPNPHNQLCEALRLQGRIDQAIDECRAAIKLDSRYVLAYGNLGVALLGHGEIDKAIEAFHKAVDLAPNFPPPHADLCDALRRQGTIDKAIEECQMAVRLAPDYARAYDTLGSALEMQNKPSEAIAAFQRAVTLEPNSDRFRQHLDEALGLHR